MIVRMSDVAADGSAVARAIDGGGGDDGGDGASTAAAARRRRRRLCCVGLPDPDGGVEALLMCARPSALDDELSRKCLGRV